MAQVIIENVFKTYRGERGREVTAVEDFNLRIEDEEFVVFVGPSGCGKSTTLRMIAGLEEISKGSVYVDDRRVNDVPPKDRDIAMVFQNYALYPHMTVAHNMAFGLKLRQYPQDEIDRRVREAAQILGLTDEMLLRKPKALSGGQRQRVAVGRAIVRKPKVFLFDEPLSNLDAKMRVSMRAEISKLHASLNATMIYVTHDQVEAMTMGDRIVVMKDGRIQQVAQPMDIYHHPANVFVAGFVGSPPMNFFEGVVHQEGGNLVFTEATSSPQATPFSLVLEGAQSKRLQPWQGKGVVLGIRPEDIECRMPDSRVGRLTSFAATLEVVEPLGAETYLYLKTGAHSFIARSEKLVQIKAGQRIEVSVNLSKAVFFASADKSGFKKIDRSEFDLEKWQAACNRIV